MAEIVCAIFCGAIAVGCAVISILQFKEKGFLFNNAYIWASPKERETMDKAPHYRQSGVAFAFIAAIFLCMALECLLQTGWLWGLVTVLTLGALAYAIVSSLPKRNP